MLILLQNKGMMLVPKRDMPVMAKRRHDEKVFRVFKGGPDQWDAGLVYWTQPDQWPETMGPPTQWSETMGPP